MELNETERAVLYCWINDNELINTSGLREDDFSSQTLKCAYRASRSLRAQNEPVDMITLTERCESLDMALPPEGGWFQYFAALVRDFYLAGRYAEYESRLIERRNRLQAAKAGELIQALAFDAKRPYAEVHSDIMALADGIPGNEERQIKAASDIAVETYAHLNRVISGVGRGWGWCVGRVGSWLPAGMCFRGWQSASSRYVLQSASTAGLRGRSPR